MKTTSRFAALSARRTVASVAEMPARAGKVARRANPDYQQFSAYVPVGLYRKLRKRIVGEMDLSQAVETALAEWLQRTEKAAG